ncbi:hypothetical protein COO91_01775 [Nostoc flagelliforme CCNUN1]|uniref:Uncharacterized protein n=1 Tax=Nostoc flagelliforme CCNUN1 TaxID=2038116 RepID=A0A2K8SKC1_9NOSO|nr:hypothetical protein COO91_01775 [Nostoc flagelliforme CCNUN1]
MWSFKSSLLGIYYQYVSPYANSDRLRRFNRFIAIKTVELCLYQ